MLGPMRRLVVPIAEHTVHQNCKGDTVVSASPAKHPDVALSGSRLFLLESTNVCLQLFISVPKRLAFIYGFKCAQVLAAMQ